MNARIELGALSLGAALSALWDPEQERNILGAAMLGYAMPAWLEPQHFFPTQHQAIYDAVRAVGGNVAHVNAWLRESGSAWGPGIVTPAELAKMCDEAIFALDNGWALEFEAVRELARRRALVETMQRVAVELRADAMTHREARKRLSEHFQQENR